MTYCSMCKSCKCKLAIQDKCVILENTRAERERLISLLKKKSVFVVFPKLRAEIEKEVME